MPLASAVEAELAARLDAYRRLQASPNYPLLTPAEVRAVGAYGGAQGVWVNKARTSRLIECGVAVGLLHTGRHYADDLDEGGVLYHYPRTRRAGVRDEGEILAIKAAQQMRMPVFVVSESGPRRRVRLGWVKEVDDVARVALVLFDEPSGELSMRPTTGDVFVTEDERRRRVLSVNRWERDPQFAFYALRRYGGSCALTGIRVPNMLEAAHVVPVARGGSDDVGNSLVLNVALHRAFDAHLWVVHPDWDCPQLS